jgi:hypothetical protein
VSTDDNSLSAAESALSQSTNSLQQSTSSLASSTTLNSSSPFAKVKRLLSQRKIVLAITLYTILGFSDVVFEEVFPLWSLQDVGRVSFLHINATNLIFLLAQVWWPGLQDERYWCHCCDSVVCCKWLSSVVVSEDRAAARTVDVLPAKLCHHDSNAGALPNDTLPHQIQVSPHC